MLVNATVRALDGDVLVIGMGVPSLARRLSEAKNTDVVTAALLAVLGVRWQVRFEHGDGGGGSTPRAATPPPAPPRRPPPVRRSTARDDGEPLPPEPPEEETPPEDEESMIAEAAAAVPVAVRRDPEEEAIELLTSQLGARTMERG
jgi:DNA polymerase-3 subunit gamma/tau